jgi:glycosyltransferase involved in cell wall biosynthesis
MKDIAILVPVYNDLDCLHLLLSQPGLTSLLPRLSCVVIVDDGSDHFVFAEKNYPFDIQVISLQANLGHQKALAIGLSYIHQELAVQRVLVMDSDGEDGIDDAVELVKVSDINPELIILARRTSRQEGPAFKAGYRMYRLMFRVLTGYSIASGNFMVLPARHLSSLVFKNDIWNHLAAAIIKSKLPVLTIPVPRRQRFTGTSKMSLTRLVIHGLGAITVFVDHLSARLLIGSLVLLIMTAISICIIVGIKVFTTLAIPGWASVLTGVMFIIFMQSFLLTLSTVVLYLSSQSQRQFIPGAHYREFIQRKEQNNEA